MGNLSEGRHLLCLQDTCEVNLSSHKRRLNENSGLGRSDKSDTGHCFKIHPGLVLDVQGLNPLGFSHIKVFHRPEDMPDRIQRDYKQQSIKEKESYKWIEVAQTSKTILKEAATVTFIEDREGDIYEQFAMVPDEKFHLLIRSRTTRNLSNGNSLYKEMDSEPIAGTYTIELPTISLTCISVKETSQASRAINWKLLTTHKIENYEEALLMVEWYGARWYIEQLFRILKKQGFGIEETELENGWAIRKLVIMQMTALLKILQMNIAYADTEGGQPIEEVFDKEQIEVLEMMNIKLQGKSIKLQNHHKPQRTKWAAWVVGRIGGWKGYDSQGPPGVIALKRGLDRLSYIIEGTKLIKDVGTP
ncbi:transposase [Flavivirga jejuensis]|uniref:Transposase n=2 Tax=Flavivirga jejuensis TaxID=870487 RepID=A0ABT8WUT4_9FLAO|nr:transposase [Flavivirga jejuensis]MDO5976935.1 transposase [Flavivirga jejuensis]